tara:strand:+ start:187 stop:360 length:174 start_codon:yes stop_codon:yes gene_type:complete
MLHHRLKGLDIEDFLNQIREETVIINGATGRIVRLQSLIYKVQKHKEKLDNTFKENE